MSNEERAELLNALKNERTPQDKLRDLRISLAENDRTPAELAEICKQLHADFFVTNCLFDSSDKGYMNELRLTLAELCRALFKKLGEDARC